MKFVRVSARFSDSSCRLLVYCRVNIRVQRKNVIAGVLLDRLFEKQLLG